MLGVALLRTGSEKSSRSPSLLGIILEVPLSAD